MKVFDMVIYGKDEVGRVESINGDTVVVNSAHIAASEVQPAPYWIAAAWQFGGECAANGERRINPNADERSDIAAYHPDETWDAMPPEDRNRARTAFVRGVRTESRPIR